MALVLRGKVEPHAGLVGKRAAFIGVKRMAGIDAPCPMNALRAVKRRLAAGVHWVGLVFQKGEPPSLELRPVVF